MGRNGGAGTSGRGGERPPDDLAAREGGEADRRGLGATGASWLDGAVAALNGVLGDRLSRQGNGLAIEMGLYLDGRPLRLDERSLRASHPDATSKICVLVHGLCCTEQTWRFGAAGSTTYGSLLCEQLGFTPFFVRYNTGLHVPHNGRKLAELMSRLVECYPAKLDEIALVGHSMGGLVVRSACHHGRDHGHRWVGLVRRAFYLGTPHLGAPLEKLGGLVSSVLRPVPEPFSQLARDIVELRSEGIKDLRGPAAGDEAGKSPPLDPSIAHYLVAGTLTRDERHVIAALLGDALVRVPSAALGGKVRGEACGASGASFRVFPGVHHMALTRSPAVYEQIKQWCVGDATPRPASEAR